jgi:UDP-3-O-[3-hydroxymyristoyl] glucosamine N-acyltransferase
MEFTLEEIAHLLGGEVKGNGNAKVNSIAKIEEATTGSISFLSNPKYEHFIYTTHASAVIVKKDFLPKEPINTSLILVEDPYTSFTTILEAYQQALNASKIGKEEPSYLGKNAAIGDNHYIGAFAYIGNNCNIGSNVKIYPHVYIGDNVTIGDNTTLYAGVKIYANCELGQHVTIHSGCVIGSDGFGFAPQPDGSYKTIPQIGNVIIGNHVDIGANTVIDCATMGSTIIGDGVKIDNLIQIAHNVKVGKNTVIAAQAGISGSTTIGENCIIAGQVGIIGHIKIANKTTIAAQAGIGRTITEEGTTLLGSPAIEKLDFLKSFAIYRKLPTLQKRIEELEEKIVNLSVIKEL